MMQWSERPAGRGTPRVLVLLLGKVPVGTVGFDLSGGTYARCALPHLRYNEAQGTHASEEAAKAALTATVSGWLQAAGVS